MNCLKTSHKNLKDHFGLYNTINYYISVWNEPRATKGNYAVSIWNEILRRALVYGDWWHWNKITVSASLADTTLKRTTEEIRDDIFHIHFKVLCYRCIYNWFFLLWFIYRIICCILSSCLNWCIYNVRYSRMEILHFFVFRFGWQSR